MIEAGLGEVSRDRLRLGRRTLWAVAQEFGGAPVQCAAAALQQALVGRVLDQRVLEAVVRPRPLALDEKDVGLSEPLQGRPKLVLIEVGDSFEKRVRKVAVEHGPDLDDFPSEAEPIKPGGERLLQSGRDRRVPPATPRSKRRRVTLFDEQGHAPAAFTHTFYDLLG